MAVALDMSANTSECSNKRLYIEVVDIYIGTTA